MIHITIVSDSGPVAVVVIKILIDTNSGNAWKVYWFLGKQRFWTTQPPCVLGSLFEVDLFSEWLNIRMHLQPLVLSSGKRMHPGVQPELCYSSYQKLLNSVMWSQRLLILRGLIMASHRHEEDNAPRMDRVQVVFVLSLKSWFFELLQIWQISGKNEVKTCPLSVCLTPVKNGSSGWQLPLWTCNRGVELQYLPGGAAGGPVWNGLSVQAGGTWVTLAYTHTATLCHCAVTLQQLHQVGWDGSTRAAGQVDLVEMHA